jgi:16S rRNA (guanine966-N2)-methyltransferase
VTSVRVIAGSLGGRRLKAPRGQRTRPTSDRVREALFMALEPLTGLRVVDLYAGSGALGIEALSRGAARVDFVERDHAARDALEANLAELGLHERTKVWPLGLPQGLLRLAVVLAAADLVLADPPYGGGPAREVLDRLGRTGVLLAGCRVVLEHHAKDGIAERHGALVRVRHRAYGETVVTTFEAAAEQAPDAAEDHRP